MVLADPLLPSAIHFCANTAHDGLMKCRVRRSEPETTKRRHIAVPPSCELTPLSDFRLASLCPSQVDGAAPAACPTRAAEAQDAPVLRPGEAAPYAAAVAASFPRGNAAETAARSAAVGRNWWSKTNALFSARRFSRLRRTRYCGWLHSGRLSRHHTRTSTFFHLWATGLGRKRDRVHVFVVCCC